MDAEHLPPPPGDGRLTAGDADRARLVELADLCDASRTAFHQTADRFHWRPAPNSDGAALAAALPSPDPTLPKPRVETGHRLVAGVVQTYLLTAAGHLGGLGGLYRTGEIPELLT